MSNRQDYVLMAEVGRATSSAAPRITLIAPTRGRIPGGPGKRAFDILCSAALIVCLAPILLAVALAVRLTSPGPVLFWSDRVGRGGAIFSMPKFRTMTVETPLVPREAAVKGMCTLTPVGGFLRRSSLDELPQLFCVLAGKMSLIGPRPLLAADPAMARRMDRPVALGAKPGITGLAQVRGRNLVGPGRKSRLDAFYAARWSWALESRIIRDTIVYVLTGKGVV